MTYQTEFGTDYDVPAIPGLIDQSWHNDACPSFGAEPELSGPDGDIHDLRLWVQHIDPAQREMVGGRYIVNYQPWSNTPVDGVTITDDGDLYVGDDLAAALSAFHAARETIAAAINSHAK